MAEHVHEGHLETEYCPKHPKNEALLRCNRCDRLMCTKCAVRTPTGYRCDDCVKGQQKVFDTAQPQDYILGPLAAGILSLVGGLILSRFGIFIIVLGAPFVGGLIAEASRRAVGRRRAKGLFQAITAAVVIGGIAPALSPLLLSGLAYGFGGFLQAFGYLGFGLLWKLVYAVLAAGATYYRLSGLRL